MYVVHFIYSLRRWLIYQGEMEVSFVRSAGKAVSVYINGRLFESLKSEVDKRRRYKLEGSGNLTVPKLAVKCVSHVVVNGKLQDVV